MQKSSSLTFRLSSFFPAPLSSASGSTELFPQFRNLSGLPQYKKHRTIPCLPFWESASLLPRFPADFSLLRSGWPCLPHKRPRSSPCLAGPFGTSSVGITAGSVSFRSLPPPFPLPDVSGFVEADSSGTVAGNVSSVFLPGASLPGMFPPGLSLPAVFPPALSPPAVFPPAMFPPALSHPAMFPPAFVSSGVSRKLSTIHQYSLE